MPRFLTIEGDHYGTAFGLGIAVDVTKHYIHISSHGLGISIVSWRPLINFRYFPNYAEMPFRRYDSVTLPFSLV